MTTGFYVYTKRKGIVGCCAIIKHVGVICPVIILACNGNALAELYSATYAYCKGVVAELGAVYKVVMHQGWRYLERYPVVEFPGNVYLVDIGQAVAEVVGVA